MYSTFSPFLYTCILEMFYFARNVVIIIKKSTENLDVAKHTEFTTLLFPKYFALSSFPFTHILSCKDPTGLD